jgi:hypothetical protein
MHSSAWKQAVEDDGHGEIEVPTTLGRIERGLARRIIARGYLNTYLVTLYLAPLEQEDLGRLETLSDRLSRICEEQNVKS